MPIRRAPQTATEVVLAREAAEPLLLSITQRLLRGGLASFVEFRRAYATECARAVPSSSSPANKRPSGAASSSPSEEGRRPPPPPASPLGDSIRGRTGRGCSSVAAATPSTSPPPPHRRVNPEGLKAVFAQSGVLLTSEDYKVILLAFSDSVGFVLADDFLAALHPCLQCLSADVVQSTAEVMTPVLFAPLPLSCPTVSVDSARETLAAVFAPHLSEEEVGDTGSLIVEEWRAALQGAQADLHATFIAATYPELSVPRDDITTFITLTLQQHPCLQRILLARCTNAAASFPLQPASSGATVSPVPRSSTLGIDGSATYSLRHTGCTTTRLFERYEEDKDRRDEWIHGRQEADARPMYQRHTAGYGGHLPEYQYHFGRTFHVIEEDLPQLTQPKTKPLEPVPADWYGPGVELKDSRMNAHHYRFA